MELYYDIINGNKRALARLITLVENGDKEGLDVYEKLYRHVGRAKRVGVTGPPGVGKSTIIDLLVKCFLDENYKVGIVAVDPSSAYTGGAVLGDRIRMKSIAKNDRCFIRSMATRGQLGGVSKTTLDVVNIMDSAGYDYIFIETVGIGQSEIDIVKLSDIVILVTVPDLGDDIQAFKAGVMEIGDVIVINKADREGASKTYSVINSMLSLKEHDKPKLLMCECMSNRGVSELKNEIQNLLDYSIKNNEISKRRNEIYIEELKKKLSDMFVELVFKSDNFEDILHHMYDKKLSPYSGAKMLIKNLCNREGEHDI